MANWFNNAQRYIAQATAVVFGLDPATSTAADFIRFAYKSNTTTSQADNNKNVCYIALSAAPENGKAYKRTYIENGKAVIERVIPLNCLFTFFGPDAYTNAELLRSGIMHDGGVGTPRNMLRTHNIVPVRMPDSPTTMPQIQDGYWRFRADVRVQFVLHRWDEQGFSKVDPSTEVEIGVITERGDLKC